MYTYTDKNLTCADCNQEFSFSASEQQFYADRQFSEPRRCPSCRAIRKSQRGDSGGSFAGNGARQAPGRPKRGVTEWTGYVWRGGPDRPGEKYGVRPCRVPVGMSSGPSLAA